MPVWAIYTALALSAIGTGYAGFASERARNEAVQNAARARKDALDQRSAEQNRIRQEAIDAERLGEKQRAEQAATEERLRSEQQATLEKVRGEVPGIRAQLGADLLAQQEKAYAKMDPQIEARLNALGLLQSGALVEAKARAQGDLESQRQATLADFGTNAAQRLNIEQPLVNSSADVGRQYEGLQRNLDFDRSALSQRFASAANAEGNEVARSQYLSGMDVAKNSANQAAASSYMNAAAQLGSGLINYAASRRPKNPSLDALYSYRNNGGYL